MPNQDVNKRADEIVEMFGDKAILHVEKIIELTTHDLGHDQTARGICEEYQQILSNLRERIKQ